MYCENLNCANDQCRDFPDSEMVLRDDSEIELEGDLQGDVCPECVDEDRELRFTI